MFYLNDELNNEDLKDGPEDIIHIVPLDVLKGDESFYNYVYESNNK